MISIKNRRLNTRTRFCEDSDRPNLDKTNCTWLELQDIAWAVHGRVGDMADKWEITSNTYDNCNCAVNCGCQFNLPTTYGYCQSAYAGTIVEGYFNETRLEGLNWAALYKWPGEIADGGGERQIIIDERANDDQRHALETIIAGEACVPLSNVFSVYGTNCSDFYETLFLPINLETDIKRKTARVEIPGILKGSGAPIMNEFSGEPFEVGLMRPAGSIEFTHAHIVVGESKVMGDIEMAFENSFAMFCTHHFNQDGIIRNQHKPWIE